MVTLNLKVPKEKRKTWKSIISYFYKSVLPLLCGMLSTYYVVLGYRPLGLMFLIPAVIPLIVDLKVEG